jgi:Ca-activated chloride channel family protein
LYALRRKKSAVRIPSLALVRDAATPTQHVKRHLPPALFLLALVAMFMAVSRPATVASVPTEQRTVILAIDVSLSMAADDISPTRLEAAQAAAKEFVKRQPRDVRVGIVAFAGHADLVLPPTTRRSEALAAIDHLQLQYSTALGHGIVAALMTIFPEADIAGQYDIFGTGRMPYKAPRIAQAGERGHPGAKPQPVPPGSHSSAAIVLLTDGRSTFGIGHDQAAHMAAELGVRVYTVGFGKAEGGSIALADALLDVEFDEPALKEIAAATGGSYFHASTAEELKSVYRDLTGRIVLERKFLELTALFTALGAVLSLSSVGLSFAWSPRFT